MIQEKFGISIAQASGDIQAYLEKNPGSLIYDKNRKYYAAAPTMKMVLGQPLFEEALDLFFGGESLLYSSPSITSGSLSSGVDSLLLPARTAQPEVLQGIFRASYQRQAIPIYYFSVARGEAIWRTIEPRAFGYDGQRWHVRAFCQERKDFRDFVLGRIEKIGAPSDPVNQIGKDLDWETEETFFLAPADELNSSQRKAIEMDYHMQNGLLQVKVRRAMKHYFLRSLRIDLPEQTDEPLHLKLTDAPPFESSQNLKLQVNIEVASESQSMVPIVPTSTGSGKVSLSGVVLMMASLPELPYLDEEILNALMLLTLCVLPEEAVPKIDYRIDEGIVWSERVRESITTAKNNRLIESADQIKITADGIFTIQSMIGANGEHKSQILRHASALMGSAANKPHALLQAAVAFATSAAPPQSEAHVILDFLTPHVKNRNFICNK
jgi:hypothetical protein